MKLKFMQKDVDIVKMVEKEQSDILFNRMIKILNDLSESHPDTKEANKESIKELKKLNDLGMLFKLFVEDNKNTFAGYINGKKIYEMYVIEIDNKLAEVGNIFLIDDKEEIRSEYTILSGLDKGEVKLWLGEYDYNYFEKGEENYSLR